MSQFDEQTAFVKTIPHRDWNKAVRRFARSRPLTVRVLPPSGLTHAWRVSPSWSAEDECWAITVRPGYVSGEPVTLGGVTIRERVPYSIANERWRSIGSDAVATLGGGESVPEYFRALGVGPADSEVAIQGETLSVTLSGDRSSPKKRRLLRAVELVLTQPRAAVRLVWDETPDGGLSPRIDVVAAAGGPFLSVMRSYSAAAEVASSREELVSGLVDEGRDEMHIATIYLVSPPDASPGMEIDATWTPYVRHRVFRNLNHAVNHEIVPVLESPLVFSTFGLGGGSGEALVQGLLAGLNDAEAQMQAYLNRSRIRGAFWTI